MMISYRLYKNIHLWLTFPFGLFIFLISFSGAMLVFEHEITDFIIGHGLGELSGKPLRLPFFAAMYSIHRELGIGATGKILIGISVWGLFLLLLSGVLMWQKTASKHPLRGLKLNYPTPLRGWHSALGVYTFLFIFLMGATGLTWNEQWYQRVFYSILDSGEGTLYHTVYDIHTGAWGGIPTRLIWMVCALACASFPVTGLWIYFSSLRSTRR